MTLWKRYRDAILCVVLLSVPFFFLRASTREPGRLDEIDRFVLRVSAPLQTWIGTRLAAGLADIWGDYIYLVHVKRDIERLRAENARLRQDVEHNQAAFEENRRLRQLLELRKEMPIESFAAEVVARDTSPFFRVIRIAITSVDPSKLRTGMPVVTTEGLVGQINSIVGRYANLTLIVDSRSAVDAMIERNGARGILHGTGERNRYTGQVEYLQRDDDVRVGDKLITSGLGCRFPAGLMLGKITNVTRRNFQMYQEVELAPAVDFSRLHEVLVLATPPTDCRPGVPTQRRPGRGANP